VPSPDLIHEIQGLEIWGGAFLESLINPFDLGGSARPETGVDQGLDFRNEKIILGKADRPVPFLEALKDVEQGSQTGAFPLLAFLDFI
jgi:hypothetical protein